MCHFVNILGHNQNNAFISDTQPICMCGDALADKITPPSRHTILDVESRSTRTDLVLQSKTIMV